MFLVLGRRIPRFRSKKNLEAYNWGEWSLVRQHYVFLDHKHSSLHKIKMKKGPRARQHSPQKTKLPSQMALFSCWTAQKEEERERGFNLLISWLTHSLLLSFHSISLPHESRLSSRGVWERHGEREKIVLWLWWWMGEWERREGEGGGYNKSKNKGGEESQRQKRQRIGAG